MRIVFIGVGEAFDERLPNTSVLVDSETKLLLDCGYSVPQSLWSYSGDANLLDAIYISHFHTDHYFGLPALIIRMWEGGRTKELVLIGQEGLKEQFHQLMEMGYKGFLGKLGFKTAFRSAERPLRLNELDISTAPTRHSAENLAVKVGYEGGSVCYSGDGISTPEAEALYMGSDILVHDSYLLERSLPGVHPSIKDVLGLSESTKKLFLVHIQRELRKEKGKIMEFVKSNRNVEVPEPHDTLKI